MNELHAIDLSHPVLRWIALLIVEVTLVSGAALLASRLLRRDAASRHAVLLIALLVVLASPFAAVIFERAGWDFVTDPVPRPAVTPAVPTDPAENGRYSIGTSTSPAVASSPTVAAVPTSDAVALPTTSPAPESSQTPAHIVADSSPDRTSADSANGSAVATRTPLSAVDQVLLFVFAIWSVGLLVCFARMVHGWRTVRRLYRSAVPLRLLECSVTADRVEKRLQSRTRLNILVSDEIATAVATGLMRPVILVPRSYVEKLSAEELLIVLMHEAAHVVRRDLIVGLLQRVATAIYWPHPLVHLLNQRLSRSREEVCDNYVLQQHDSPGYAEVLLRIVISSGTRAVPSGTLAFFNRRWKLEDRIAGLLDSNRSRATHPRRRLLACAAILMAGLGMTFAGLRFIDGPVEYVVAAEPSKVGEPLPGGASLRLGDNRFRHSGWQKNIAYAADGKQIVSSSDNSMRFWNAATGELLREVSFENFNKRQMRVSADGKKVVCVGYWIEGQNTRSLPSIRIWDAETGELTGKVEWQENDLIAPTQLAITPDARFALVGDSRGYISVVDLAFGTRLLRYRLLDREVDGFAISPDGNLIAATSTQSRILFVWEWQTGAEPTLLSAGQRFAGVAFSPDSKRLAVGLESGPELYTYNLKTQAVEQTFTDPSVPSIHAEGLAFTPDGKQLAVANYARHVDGKEAAVLLWEVESGKLLKRFSAPPMEPRDLAISPDGDQVAAIDWETNIRLWNIQTGESVGSQAGGHNGLIRSMAFANSSTQLFTASDDQTVRIWNPQSGEEVGRLAHNSQVYSMALSPDGKSLATSTVNDTISLWDLSAWNVRQEIKGTRRLGTAWALAITPDGKELRALQDDLKLCAWETATAKPLRNIQLRPTGLDLSGEGLGNPKQDEKSDDVLRENIMHLISDYAFTPDGKKLVLVGRQDYWIFDVTTGAELSREQPMFSPYSVAVSADSRFFAIGGRAQGPGGPTYLKVFDLNRGITMFQKAVVCDFCGPMTFSKDGSLCVVMRSSTHNTIDLSAFTGGQSGSIQGVRPLGGRGTIAFSPDGKQFAGADADSMVLIWDVAKLGASSKK